MAVDGTYNIEIDSPIGKQVAKLTLKSAGEKLSGTMVSSLGNTSFNGAVKSNAFAWNMEINSPMGKMWLTLKGKVAGNDISGRVTAGNLGTFLFKGKRA